MTDFDPLDTFRATVVPTDQQRSDRIREEFRARIATMAPDDEGHRPFDPRHPTTIRTAPRVKRQPLLALASLAIILGLAAGGAFLTQHNRTGATSLEELAAVARTQPDIGLDAAQYLHRIEQSADGSSPDAVEEQWTARDGTGRTSTSAMSIGPAGTVEPSTTLFTTPGSLQFAHLSYDQLRRLPTDPNALLARLNELGVAKGPRAVDQAEAVTEVLALAVTPPEVVAAGVQALAQLGGTAIGPVQTSGGASGLGVQSTNDDGTTWVVVLDPNTGRALAFHPNVERGSSLTNAMPYRVWVEQQITDALPVT